MALPAYLVAVMLVFFPLVDTVMAVLPARMGDATWRFGMVGLFSRALLMPMLGAALAIVLACVLEQRRVLRVLSIVSALLVVLTVLVLAGFVLDALQVRAQLRPALRGSVVLATATVLAKYGLALTVGLTLTIVGWRNSRGTRDKRQAVHALPMSEAIARTKPSGAVASSV